MKQKQKFYKRPLFYALTFMVVMGVVIIALELTDTTHFFHQSTDDKQKQTSAKVDLQKKQAATNSPNESTVSDKSTPNSSTNYTPPTNTNNIVLSALRSSSETVTITTRLYNYSDGQCDLTITNGSNQYKKSVSIIYQSEFSTCAGFTVPVTSLGTGTWNISLSVTSGGISQVRATAFEVK
jgi:hypothetical protein